MSVRFNFIRDLSFQGYSKILCVTSEFLFNIGVVSNWMEYFTKKSSTLTTFVLVVGKGIDDIEESQLNIFIRRGRYSVCLYIC